jgi:hypothetical protein
MQTHKRTRHVVFVMMVFIEKFMFNPVLHSFVELLNLGNFSLRLCCCISLCMCLCLCVLVFNWFFVDSLIAMQCYYVYSENPTNILECDIKAKCTKKSLFENFPLLCSIFVSVTFCQLFIKISLLFFFFFFLYKGLFYLHTFKMFSVTKL